MILRFLGWKEHQSFWNVFEILFLGFNLLLFVGIAKKIFWKPFKNETGIFGSLPTSETDSKGIRMNILCAGVDSVDGTHRSDTILIVGVDAAETKISIVSIPRDTRVITDGVPRKINEILSRYGIETLRTIIEELMEIRIGRFAKVDYQGFTKIVDLIGGLDLQIDVPMHYDDNWGNVHIHFDVGQHHLDGKKALEYVRFRADANADLGRIKRQQRFLTAVFEKLRKPEILLKLPGILQEAFKNVETDLTFQEIMELAYALKGQKIKIQADSLPGQANYIDKLSFFVPMKSRSVELGAKWFSRLTSLELDASFSIPLATASGP